MDTDLAKRAVEMFRDAIAERIGEGAAFRDVAEALVWAGCTAGGMVAAAARMYGLPAMTNEELGKAASAALSKAVGSLEGLRGAH